MAIPIVADSSALQRAAAPVGQGTAPPDVDAVIVRLAFTVERDYIERDVFPKMRREQAVSWSGSSAFFYLTQSEAKMLLADARARAGAVRRAAKNAYGHFVRALEHAIEEARTRRAVFAAKEPVCLYRSEYSEEWRGSKEQLQAIGIRLSGPWPGEPGGKERWSKATDARGYPANITRSCSIWGLFGARIDIPTETRVAAARASASAARQEQARDALQEMPNSADDFRRHCVRNARTVLASVIRATPSSWHGYSLEAESVQAILMSCDAVVEAIMQADVAFDRLRHQSIILAHQREIAGADTSFQRTLCKLTKPNPAILEERAP